MFAEGQSHQEMYAEHLFVSQMRSRKRHSNTSAGNEDAKRVDDRNKENCSPDIPMMPFYPGFFPPPTFPCMEQSSMSSDSGINSDESSVQQDSAFDTSKTQFPPGLHLGVERDLLYVEKICIFFSEAKPTTSSSSQQQDSPSVNPLEVFDEAPGRLCLLNASTKYKVTLSEIHRRMSHPETLHASLINGVLRKAKTKDGCKMLRDRLAEKGVSLPSGRRKTAPTTAFTALCEREALVMARDFNTLCNNSLNTFEIARHASRLQQTPQELAIIRRFLAGVMAIFDEVPEDPEDYVEKNSATHAINIFSMLTHGFGHNVLKSAWRVLGKIVDQQYAMLQGGQPQGPPPPPPFMPYHMQQFM
ncbi:transcription factor AP-2 [Necator americanus]|uniref:Transcription factor AP-2 n=1 Tax=Necator americanus TaxID=51031 RepID=W2TZL1_NECAM|nr:transcription factor AP-2 [Necator americanus]ETN86511.1 transcription factor AP-2 [Necator americanus]